jgi:4-hydroxyphenylacetate 3-monooxygenase
VKYHRTVRDNDTYVVYAVVPPQAARNPEFYHKQNIPVPTLRVVKEDDSGVVISGMKMLATGALYANEIWIGNVIPLWLFKELTGLQAEDPLDPGPLQGSQSPRRLRHRLR